MKTLPLLCALVLLSPLTVDAADPAPAAPQGMSGMTPGMGAALMTKEERMERRAKMQAATPEERKAMRAEHHRKMVDRAKEKGVVLPENPPVAGMGAMRGMRP